MSPQEKTAKNDNAKPAAATVTLFATGETSAAAPEPIFVDVSKWTCDEFRQLANASGPDREAMVLERSIKVSDLKVEDVRSQTPLAFSEDVLAQLLLAFGVPGSLFVVPSLFMLVGYLSGCGIGLGLLYGLLCLLPLGTIRYTLT